MSIAVLKEKIRKEEYKFCDYDSWLPKESNSGESWEIPKKINYPDYSNIPFATYSSSLIVDIDDDTYVLPSEMEDLALAISDSKYLLSLKEDWDDEGALPIKNETWRRAVFFIIDYALWLFNEQQNFVLTSPQINPGPNSTIDLLWRSENYRLLVNIPENLEYPIEYYGDNNKGENSIKGRLKAGQVQEYFALWLKNLKK